jgi:hypothetical protein
MTYFTATVSMDRYNAAVRHMSDWAANTAADLVRSWQRYGSLTHKQAALLEKLVAEAEAKQAAPKTKASQEKLDLTGINAMFDKAKAAGLKRMVVRFLDESGERFTVSPAAATSQNAGMLYVKSSQDGYLGKITRDGEFKGAYGSAADAAARAQAALIEFNKDPAGKAKLYGKQTSTCCFCGLALTDNRSVMAGYGPICAGNYGLPIPSVAEAKAWAEKNLATLSV